MVSRDSGRDRAHVPAYAGLVRLRGAGGYSELADIRRGGFMLTHKHVLVVEDDVDTRDFLERILSQAGATVTGAEDGEQALRLAHETKPDLVTLDLNLPDAHGTDICRQLRTFSDAYIMMITSRADQADRLIGLEVGADDYLVKPFSPQEVRARAAALLRRPRVAVASASPIEVHGGSGLLLLTGANSALLNGKSLPLTRAEVDLLTALAGQPNRVWSRQELAQEVWHGDFLESDYLVDMHVGSVRRKLRRAGSTRDWISTVDGACYALAVDEAGPPASSAGHS